MSSAKRFDEGVRRALVSALIAALLLAPALGSPAQAAALDRYVSPTGSNSNSGSLSHPWRTVGYALSRLRAGYTLYVRGGTYVENLSPTLADGTSSARITVSNYPGESPTIKGFVAFSDPDYWTISGLRFTWNTGSWDQHMVKIAGGTGWVLDHVRVYGSRSRAGLLIAKSVHHGAPHRYTVRYSAFYDNLGETGANVYLNPGLDATDGLLERNIFYNSNTENIKIGFGGEGSELSDPLNGAADVTFRYNTVYSGWQPVTVAEPARDIRIYRNIIVRGTRNDSTGSYLIRLDGTEGRLGARISVHDNIGFDARRWCWDAGSNVTCREVDDGGNRFPVNPSFASVNSPVGFHPLSTAAWQHGRYARTLPSAPIARLAAPAAMDQNQLPVTAVWTGPGGVGYELGLSRDGAPFASVGAVDSPRKRLQLAPGHDYRLRVRAVDSHGSRSPWQYGGQFWLGGYQESAGALSYSTGWRTDTDSDYWGGGARYASADGAKVTLDFSGRSIAWVSALGPTRGRAAAYVDGSYAGTISLRSRSVTERQVVFARAWPSRGTHRLTLVLLPTSDGSRIDVDAFAVER